MFYHASIAWHWLLRASVIILLEKYNLTEGSLLLDETERQRAKKTSKIFKTHKMKAKKTGGYMNGQEIVFLILVTSKITLPVDFRFYKPDPDMTAWRKERDRLRKQKVPPARVCGFFNV